MFIRDYYEQLYTNIMNNLKGMDKLVEMYNLPRLNQEEIRNINKLIISNEIESVIKKFPENKISGPSQVNSARHLKTFKEELMPILKLFQKIQEERMQPNSFYKASITLISKPDKDTKKKKRK